MSSSSSRRKVLAAVQVTRFIFINYFNLLKTFCTSSDFESDFEQFAKEHSDVFRSSIDCKTGEGEHALEYYEVYQEYLRTFEGKIEDFINEVKILYFC